MCSTEPLLFADDLRDACQYCTSIFYLEATRAFPEIIAKPTDPSATVTFIAFRDKTYAITAAHVVNDFRASVADPQSHFFCLPAHPGVILYDRFYQPPAGLSGKEPDVSFMEVAPAVPQRLGKRAFELGQGEPPAKIPYAMALGYPNDRKWEQVIVGGTQVAMPCCQAVAEGVSLGYGDQVQFYSEIDVPTSDLSGMSGGPVFSSDGHVHQLVGIVKQAMGPNDSEVSGRVHFVCQRISPTDFENWESGIPAQHRRNKN